MKYLLIIFLNITSLIPVFPQVNDTTLISFQEFMSAVSKKHPLAKAARLQPEIAQTNLRSARGAFDPVLFADFDDKYFNSKNYFKLFSSGIKIPTWFGLTAQAGYERNAGLFLNPEDLVPQEGLKYVGLSLPLGQNLLIDQRRAGIRQARINIDIARNQEFILLNTTLLQASEAFWEWNNAWEKYKVYQQIYDLAMNRYEFTVRSFILGDKAAIDTVEAFSIYNLRRSQLMQMQLEFQNQGYQLNNYLWVEDISVETAIPVHSPYTKFDHDSTLSAEAVARNHPEIQNQVFNLQSLQIDRRLKTEKLKPKFNLNYNILSGSPSNNGVVFSTNNYKWGFEFSFPLFLREGRGELQFARLKITQQELFLNQKVAELTNQVRIVMNLLNNLQSQIQLQKQTVSAMDRLLQGERQLYLLGETSLFVLNTRETAYLDASMKLIDLQTKYAIYYYQLQYLKGQPIGM